MSVACGLECVVCLGCSRWAWKRFTYIGSYDSESWPPATPSDFEPITRMCRAILAVYEDDLAYPKNPPAAGYCMNPTWLAKRVTYQETEDCCPPYLIYADHNHKEIILAVVDLILLERVIIKCFLIIGSGCRCLMGDCSPWVVEGGYLGFEQGVENLRKLLRENGWVFDGHSLGSGVVALMTIIVVNHRNQFGGSGGIRSGVMRSRRDVCR